MYTGPDSLGLRVRITGLVSFVASGLSEKFVPVNAVGLSESLERVAQGGWGFCRG